MFSQLRKCFWMSIISLLSDDFIFCSAKNIFRYSSTVSRSISLPRWRITESSQAASFARIISSSSNSNFPLLTLWILLFLFLSFILIGDNGTDIFTDKFSDNGTDNWEVRSIMVYKGGFSFPVPAVNEIRPRCWSPALAFTIFCFVVWRSALILSV